MRRLGLVFALLIGLPGLAAAQIDSREGIALQNQILQLRQELEMMRRGGGSLPPPQAGGGFRGFGGSAQAPQTELVGTLLERVQRLEEELRSVRGRAEQSEFRERQLQERLEKLEGDLDFRLQQIEGQRQGAATPPARPAAPPAGSPPATPAATPSRPPQRALAEGQTALGRRDYATAEAAAREVIAGRDPARSGDAYMLLGDALLGRRDFAGAAVAFDDARRRNPRGARAPEATVGIATALVGLNNNRDACALLNELRGTTLTGPVASRAADARRRAQCR